jgi:hypothetical protein
VAINNREQFISDPEVQVIIKSSVKQLKKHPLFRSEVAEHLESDLRCHLLEGADDWDPKRGSRAALANVKSANWVRQQIRHRDRKKRRQGFEVQSLDAQISCRSGKDTSLLSLLELGRIRYGGSRLNSTEMVELRDCLAHALRKLKPPQRQPVVDGVTQGATESAEDHGLKVPTLRGWIAKFRRDLKEALNPK